MEFGSLGLSSSQGQSQSAQPNQTPATDAGAIQSNPENVVTPPAQAEPAPEDRRQDVLGRQAEDEQQGETGRSSSLSDTQSGLTRRTTLNFDSEQNRVFLEVVDQKTDEVIQRIPSENFVKFVSSVLDEPTETDTSTPDEPGAADTSA
jgi:uncharacterized FlaG/YvyC family protein